MFDWIKLEHDCYGCGTRLEYYQTKSLNCLLDVYKLGDEIKELDSGIVPESFEIHDSCDSCKTWIEGRVYITNGRLAKVTEYRDGKEVVVSDINKRTITKHKS